MIFVCIKRLRDTNVEREKHCSRMFSKHLSKHQNNKTYLIVEPDEVVSSRK